MHVTYISRYQLYISAAAADAAGFCLFSHITIEFITQLCAVLLAVFMCGMAFYYANILSLLLLPFACFLVSYDVENLKST